MTTDQLLLSERVALVTGSTSGIGRSIAHRLGDDGATVAINGRSDERVAKVVAELESVGIEAFPLVGDVSRADATARMLSEIEDRAGRLDIVVNNAGVTGTHPTATLRLEDWESVLRTNLTGPFAVAKAAYPLLARRGGVIVNMSSILGHVGIAERAAYAAAKHGLEGLTKALAVEWAGSGIRVVAVSPGPTVTPLIADTMSNDAFRMAQRVPLGRLGDPEDVAEVVAFLVSDRASYLTGTSVVIDGGWLAQGGWRFG